MESGSIFIIPPSDYENNKPDVIFMGKYQEMIDNATIPSEYFNKEKFDPFNLNDWNTDSNPNID